MGEGVPPHPTEFVAIASLPSPTRGEGKAIHGAFAARPGTTSYVFRKRFVTQYDQRNAIRRPEPPVTSPALRTGRSLQAERRAAGLRGGDLRHGRERDDRGSDKRCHGTTLFCSRPSTTDPDDVSVSLRFISNRSRSCACATQQKTFMLD